MSKLVIEIEINGTLSNNDVIRFNRAKNKWEVVSYKTFNNELYKERNKLEKEIKDLTDQIKQDLNEYKQKTNEKLKLHNDALKLLTGRDL